jgi:FtsH-binding integral membrane protein
MLIVDGKNKTFNIFAIGLGLTGAGLWILSMLGPAFALHLQHASPLSAWAYDSQVACFLALLIATMFAIAL